MKNHPILKTNMPPIHGISENKFIITVAHLSTIDQ